MIVEVVVAFVAHMAVQKVALQGAREVLEWLASLWVVCWRGFASCAIAEPHVQCAVQ